MQKLLIALAAVVLACVFIAPDLASADEVKHMYIIRYRGMTADNADGNDRSHDGNQYGDWLVRPRWTYTSEGGKVWAIYELDLETDTFGDSTSVSKKGVEVNRWLVDFAIPGTTLRARFGRTDWTGPGKTGDELFGGDGRGRWEGYGIYGKLFGPVSMELWQNKTNEGFSAATDRDFYMLALTWKLAPAISIIPWLLWEHDNTGTSGAGTPNYDIWWYALTFQGKFGIASLEATGVWEDGDVEYPGSVSTHDIDIQAWALLIRLWLNFGKLKLGVYGTFLSGDDDTTSAHSRTGIQPDNKLKRFVGASNGGAGRLDGPQLYTRRRYHTFASGYFQESQPGGGNGGLGGNGVHIYEILAHYQLTEQLLLMGNVSLIRSAARAANLDTNQDGIVDTAYVSDKEIGTEVDVSAKYYLYKNLFMMLTFAYMFAGDYGRVSGARDFDDTWALFYEMRLTFKE